MKTNTTQFTHLLQFLIELRDNQELLKEKKTEIENYIIMVESLIAGKNDSWITKENIVTLIILILKYFNEP